MKDKKATLKEIIRELHNGLPVEKARDRVRQEIGSISTQELVEIEQALMDEGLPPDEVTRFCNVHVLLCADCVGYALGGLPKEIAEGRVLAIACPKLDAGQEIYVEKLVAMIDHARIRSITVARMEVPCCRGLVGLALQAQRRAERQVPVSEVVVSIDGGMIREATKGARG